MEKNECPICMSAGYLLKKPFGCSHVICTRCFKQWKESCPMCRKKLPKEKCIVIKQIEQQNLSTIEVFHNHRQPGNAIPIYTPNIVQLNFVSYPRYFIRQPFENIFNQNNDNHN